MLIRNDDNEKSQDDFVHLTSQPSSLVGGTLKGYQLVGLNWLITLNELGINGILADEMGLGKTIQIISFLSYLSEYRKINGPHLIVCPNGVLLNWQKEFKKWLPTLRVVKLLPRKEFRQETFQQLINTKKFDVVLTTYEGINICKKELKRFSWKYIIVDEAHRLKNEASVLSRNLREYQTDLKILMTGTPLQNNLRELWALLNFLLPEVFDDPEIFELGSQIDKNNTISAEEQEKKNVELIQSMHRILRPFILKRSKDTVDLKLPPKTEIHIFVGLTESQLNMYKSILTKKPFNEDTPAIRNILMQLRKCCNHPFLFPGVEGEDTTLESLVSSSGKMIVLDKMLERFKAQGKQVLIFSQFTSMLSIIEDYLLFKEYSYCRIDGETFIDERERQIEEFNCENSEKFVFLLSTRAGGLGINLASADTVIIFDSDWNPQVDLQAMDRAHRIGQKSEVRVYRLVAESTVEEKMIERQRIKMKWDSLVILRGKSTSKQALSKRELAALVNYGANTIFRAEGGTFKDEDIDQILHQGARKTAELNNRIDEAFKAKNGLLDLNIESINIYEFEGDDYNARKAADEAAITQAIDEELALRKLKKRTMILPLEPVKPLPVNLPEHHFYQNKERLTELMSKEEFQLSAEEKKEKESLLNTGFTNWNKNDLHVLIRAIERFGQDEVDQIAEAVKKTREETQEYLSVFFERIGELQEGDKILKNIDRAVKLREVRCEKQTLLRKKCEGIDCFENLTFEVLPYNKVRSKLMTIYHDKFLVFACYQYGLGNMKQVKQAMLNEPLFRFDFYIKSLRESVLTKRMASLLKMLQNEEGYLNSDRYQVFKQKEIAKKMRELNPLPKKAKARSRSRPRSKKPAEKRPEAMEIEEEEENDQGENSENEMDQHAMQVETNSTKT